MNDLRVSFDKFLILDRYSLPEAELRWFYYSLFLYLNKKYNMGSDRLTCGTFLYVTFK